MGLSIKSKGYDIVANGVVSTFDDNSDITFQFKADETFGFGFDLRLIFENDDSGKQKIDIDLIDGIMAFKCLNFMDTGTGTSAPIKIASADGKSMYMRFWSYLDGNVQGVKKTRKVEYTFFVGK